MKVVNGGVAIDERGAVSFFNGFDFKGIKRCYIVENHQKGQIRAWHGHKKETKYVLVVSGTARIAAVDMKTHKVTSVYVSSDVPQIIHIPPGYYNGSMAMAPNTKLIYFSTSTLEESEADDFREDASKWPEAW